MIQDEAPFTVLSCGPGNGAQAPHCAPLPGDARGLAERAAEVRAFLVEHGLWVEGEAVVLVDAAPIVGSLTVPDLAPWLGATWAGRVGVLFGRMGGRAASDDGDLVTHELVHVWLRAAGADEARWVWVDGRLSNEPALVQEGLADFVAAARSGDPFVGRKSWPAGVAPRSLKVATRCPDDLRGEAHDDGQVLSSALWEAREALGGEVVLKAIGKAAPGHTGSVADLAASLARELVHVGDAGEEARVWSQIANKHGLDRCDEAIVASAGVAVSARRGDFVIPAASELVHTRPAEQARLQAADAIAGPQAFVVDVPGGTPSVVVSLRSGEARIAVAWQSEGSLGPVTGEVALEGGAVRSGRIELPAGARRVTLRVVSHAGSGLTYNDVAVAVPVATVASPPPSSGCAGGVEPLGACLMALVLMLARRRRGRSNGRPKRLQLT